MKKTLIIIGREIRTRLRRPSFWLLCVVVPVVIVALYAIPLLVDDPETRQQTVLVVDETDFFENSFTSSEKIVYRPAGSLKYARTQMESDKHISAILFIPAREVSIPHDAFLYYRTTMPNTALQADVSEQLQTILRNNILLDVYNIPPDDYNMLMTTRVKLRTQDIESGREAHLKVRTVAGIALAALMVLAVLMFSASVLRGVAEEHGGRIAEVILSSVRPLQLLSGKIVGIGTAGLLQFVLWVALAGAGVVGVRAVAADRFDEVSTTVGQIATKGAEASTQLESIAPLTANAELMQGLESIDFALLTAMFLVYFLIGYLAFSAMFVSASQFSIPLALPLVATLLLSPLVVAAPAGNLAVGLSLFPLTAPAAMMLRLPFGVPVWQVAVSLLLLVATTVFAFVTAAKKLKI